MEKGPKRKVRLPSACEPPGHVPSVSGLCCRTSELGMCWAALSEVLLHFFPGARVVDAAPPGLFNIVLLSCSGVGRALVEFDRPLLITAPDED